MRAFLRFFTVALFVGATVTTITPPAMAAPFEQDVTLDQVVEWAVGRNLGVALARLEVPIVAADIDAAEGEFDPTFTAGAAYDREEVPTTSAQFFGSVTESVELQTGLAKLFALGTETSLELTGARTRDNSPITDPEFNPRYNAGLTLSVEQPLLRDAGRSVNLATVRLARVASEVEALRLRGAMEDVVLATEEAYWELVRRVEALKVAETSLHLAEDLEANIRERVRVGNLPPLESLAAEADVAQRFEGVLLAQQAVEDGRDTLLRVTGVADVEATTWDLRPVPTALPSFTPEKPHLAAALERAGTARTDLRIAHLGLEQRRIELQRDDNRTLPDLRLAGSAAVRALKGDTDVEELGDQLSQGDFLSYRVGLAFTYPLGNNTAEAAARQSALRRLQAQLTLRDLEVSAAQVVRSAVRGVATQAQRIATTAKAVTLEEARLAAEEEKFRVGISTSHDVLEVQDDLTAARQRHIEAQASYLASLSRLHYEEGSLLDRYRIEIEAGSE
ncbi:MAG: TolC family protein [Nitrospirota bacterium]